MSRKKLSTEDMQLYEYERPPPLPLPALLAQLALLQPRDPVLEVGLGAGVWGLTYSHGTPR